MIEMSSTGQNLDNQQVSVTRLTLVTIGNIHILLLQIYNTHRHGGYCMVDYLL